MMTSLKYSQDTDSNPQMNGSRLNDTIFTKQLMKRLSKYNDDDQVTLQESIPILYELNIFQQLTSIPDAKRRLTQQNKPNNRLQLQARFVYNLWKLIGNQFISMSYFKQIIGLFITLQISQLAAKLQQVFQNDNQLLIEILAIWQAMIGIDNHSVDVSQQNQQQHQHEHENQQQFNNNKQSSVVTDEYDQEQECEFDGNYQQRRQQRQQRQQRFGSQYTKNNYNNNNRTQLQQQQQQQRNNRTNSTMNTRQKQQQPQQQQRQSYSNNNSNNSNNNNYNKSIITQRQPNSKSRRQNIQQVTDQIYFNGLYQLPVMSVEKQKQLVNRLYVVNKNQRYQQLKKIQDEQKILKEMQECTFKPNIDKNKKYYKYNNKPSSSYTNNVAQNSKSSSTTITKPKSKTIPGFQKAIQRMKIGQQKTKQLKEKLQLRSSNYNNNITKQTKLQNSKLVMLPPKFLARENKKQQKKILFTIQFDIGRHKLTCKIHENESAQLLARNIQSIYSLKQQSYQQIKNIIDQQIQRYFSINYNNDDNNDNKIDNQQNEYDGYGDGENRN